MNELTIADRIRNIMKRRRLTQRELAETVGISQPAISLYLQGRMPPADVLFRIAQLGGNSMEWLLTGASPENIMQTVKEGSPVYGNRYLLLKLWDQLPQIIQRDILTLLRHIVEKKGVDKI